MTGRSWAVCACVLVALLALPSSRSPATARHGAGPAAAWSPRTRGSSRGRRLRRSRAQHAAGAVAAAAAELSVLLRAGLPPPLAWAELARPPVHPVVARLASAAAGAAAGGGDVAAALRAAAAGDPAVRAVPGVEGLAAAWHVTQRSGAPVAHVLTRYGELLQDEIDAQDAVDAALAAPRATARVLLALPVVGLLLGAAVGAEPVHVLLGTPAGRVSGAVGAACLLLGVLWTRYLLRSVWSGVP